MAIIKNLRKEPDTLRWSWDMGGVHYRTNADGEGLWKEQEIGRMVYADGSTGIATSMRQIVGTCQYSMAGCNSYGSAYNHIRRWFEE